MKAWRLEAHTINARRKAGSREHNARVQKVQRMAQPTIKGASNWLLAGLLIKAGIYRHLDAKPSVVPTAG